jgi:hypothetical protein
VTARPPFEPPTPASLREQFGPALSKHACRVGCKVAREFFQRFGNNDEAHLSERALAAVIAAAIEVAVRGAKLE